MSEHADRYRKLSEGFRRRLTAVPDDAWENPAPCEGWVARDVVRHLVEWLPDFFFDRWGIERPQGPSVEEDPVGAWEAVDGTIAAALEDPDVATRVEQTPMGPMSFEQAVDMIGTSDVFLHTWDLARATGLDETLDADEVARMLESMEPYDVPLRESGHYGPRVPVPDDADDQTKLIAFIGREP